MVHQLRGKGLLAKALVLKMALDLNPSVVKDKEMRRVASMALQVKVAQEEDSQETSRLSVVQETEVACSRLTVLLTVGKVDQLLETMVLALAVQGLVKGPRALMVLHLQVGFNLQAVALVLDSLPISVQAPKQRQIPRTVPQMLVTLKVASTGVNLMGNRHLLTVLLGLVVALAVKALVAKDLTSMEANLM